MHPRAWLTALLIAALGVSACTVRGRSDDDDATEDDDDSADDDDATANDDDATGDDDDATADDDDATADDDDATGDDDDATADDDDATGDDDDATTSPPPILGLWAGFIIEYAITETTWLSWTNTTVSRIEITSLDTAGGWLVGQNHPNSTDNPGAWTRIQWTFFSSQNLYHCVVISDAPTEAAALAATPADTNDQWAGCNGDSWDSLDEDPYVFAASGAYTDPAGADVQITSSTWIETDTSASTYSMRVFGVTEPYAVMQNGPNNPQYPNLFSRWDVTWVGDDLYTCHTLPNGASQSAAELVTPADPANPTVSGCLGGPWRPLTRL